MSRDTETALPNVVKDIARIIPDVRNLTVKPAERDELLLEIETQDGSRFSSRVLSDGTLRLLTLVTLKNDPMHRGVLAFEEPENGVQPQRLRQILERLFALATNFDKQDENLRQGLVNTHSPHPLANLASERLLFVGLKRPDAPDPPQAR